ncbi:MAG TPA: hypothetical protein VGE74_09290 [Gemmata sp.]
MPIRFRCSYCNRLLGIATRKAGTETTCPHCGYAIVVPMPNEDEAKTERVSVGDVDQSLGHHLTERMSEPATQVLEPPRAELPKPAPPKVAAPKPRSAEAPAAKAPQESKPQPPADPDDPPLFEGDLDDLFANSSAPAAADRPKAVPTTGQDALSIGDPPRVIVLSAQKATLLMGGVVVLLAVAFAAGYFVAR